MTRPLRIQYPGAWYHVTSRGNERRDIYSDDADRWRFLDILAQSAAIFGIEIHVYVLMTDHFHLVVRTPQANLNRFMQRFNTAYTVYFNHRHGRSGHLYHGRYKALIVDADSYLLELSRYVHLNPVRLGRNSMLSNAEKQQILQTYRWSSYGGYRDLRQCPEFLRCDKILSMLGTGDLASRRKDYRRFVLKGLDGRCAFNLKEAVLAQTFLGSEDFRGWLRDRFLADEAREDPERPAARSLASRFGSPGEIAVLLAPALAVTIESLLQARSRQRDERAIFLELCRVHLAGGRTTSSAAAALGIGVSALSQNHKRLRKRMAADQALRRRYELATQAVAGSE